MKTYGGVNVQFHAFLTSALDVGEWPSSRPGHFTPEERVPGTHWTGGNAVAKRKIPSPCRQRVSKIIFVPTTFWNIENWDNILPFVLYGVKFCLFTLREERAVKVSGKEGLRNFVIYADHLVLLR
jgi:hypothetical protein